MYSNNVLKIVNITTFNSKFKMMSNALFKTFGSSEESFDLGWYQTRVPTLTSLQKEIISFRLLIIRKNP